MTRTISILFAALLCAAASAAESPRGQWPYYGGDAGSSKYSPLTQIDPGNVSTGLTLANLYVSLRRYDEARRDARGQALAAALAEVDAALDRVLEAHGLTVSSRFSSSAALTWSSKASSPSTFTTGIRSP